MAASARSVTDDGPAQPTAIPKDERSGALAGASGQRSRAPTKELRISGQPGFVLHSYPYKETSLIVDMLTRDHGRVALVAKGAKRPLSKLRGVFADLSTAVDRLERQIGVAHADGGGMGWRSAAAGKKSALLSGFYLNELLVKLLARDDPHPGLFDHYVATLNQLAHGESPPIVLRKFERALLKETGVAGDFTICTVTGQKLQPDLLYVVDPERGPRPAMGADQWPRVAGKTLLDMEREDYSDASTQIQSKFLMRFLLAHHLGGVPLNTRQILLDLMQL
ncbi:DNA repair protein RecO [Undibacterium arcticum]